MASFNMEDDLYFSEMGDLLMGDDSKLKATSVEKYRTLIQRIVRRIGSNRGQWKTDPETGASLGDFLGQRNTEELGRAIKTRIVNQLLKGGLLSAREIEVDVFPVNQQQIGVIIMAQPTNSKDLIRVTFTYDMRDNQVIPRNI